MEDQQKTLLQEFKASFRQTMATATITVLHGCQCRPAKVSAWYRFRIRG